MSEDFGSITIDSNQPKKTEKKKERPTRKPDRSSEPRKQATPKTEPAKTRTRASKPVAEKPPKKPRQPRQFPVIGCLATLILLVVVYTAVGFFAAPAFIQSYLPTTAEKYTDLVFETKKVHFNPFTFHLELLDTTLTKRGINNTESPLLSMPVIKTQIAFFPLLRGALVSHETTVDNASVTLIKNQDQSFNFSTAFEKGLSNGAEIFNTQDIPLHFSLSNITFHNGTFTYEDKPAAKVHHGTDIELGIPTIANYAYNEKTYIQPFFSAIINGSPIRFASNATKGTEAAKVVCDINDMDVPLYFSYLPKYFPFTVDRGTGNGSIEISFDPKAENGNKLTLGVTLDATDLHLKHREKDATLDIPTSHIKANIEPLSGNIYIENIAFSDAILSLPAGSHASAIALLLPTGLSGTEPGTPKIKVDSLSIEKSSITIASKAKDQKPYYEQLSLLLKDYDSSLVDQQAALSFSGKRGGENNIFRWTGTIQQGGALGQFEAESLSIKDVLEQANLKMDSKDSGLGQLEGKLSFSHNEGSNTFDYALREASIEFSKVQLYSAGKVWLASPKIEFKNLKLSKAGSDLGEIYVDNAQLNIDTDAWPRLLKDLSSREASAILDSLEVTAEATLTKKSAPTLHISDISIKAHGLNDKELNADNINFSAKLANSGTIEAKGRAKFAPFSLWLGTYFTAIDSKTILPWFSNQALFEKSHAILGGNGIFTLPAASFKGDIQTGSAHIASQDGTVLDCKSASFKNLSYSTSSAALTIDELLFNTPVMPWTRAQNSPSPYVQFTKKLNTILSGNTARKSKFSTQISKVQFQDGSLVISDQRERPLKYSISKINGTLLAINPASPSPLLLAAKGEYQGNVVALSSKLGQSATAPTYEATISSENFQIPVELYSSIVGENRPEVLPTVTVKITQHSEEQKLNTITEVTTTDSFPESPALDLVLALLRGQDNIATLTLLTEAEQPGLDFSFTDEIEKHINKLMVKTEISPFLLAITNFEDLVGKDTVEFRFGEIAPTDKGMETLIRLKDFLLAHPYINLKVRGEASLEVDRQAFLDQLTETEQKRVEKLNKERLAEWRIQQQQQQTPQDTATALDEGGIAEQNIFIPVQPESVVVSEEMLLNLAEQRGNILQKILTEQLALAAERIEIEKAIILPENGGNVGHFSLMPRQE